jgi:hypothetical protein
MSDGGHFNSSLGSQARSRDFGLSDGHGASIVLTKSGTGVYHNQNGQSAQVLIRSYKDGMRVGCTFITNEALERIYEYHRRYVSRSDYEQHQAGY